MKRTAFASLIALATAMASSAAFALSGINGANLNIGGVNGTRHSDLNAVGALQAKRLVLPDGTELAFR